MSALIYIFWFFVAYVLVVGVCVAIGIIALLFVEAVWQIWKGKRNVKN